MRRTAEDLGDLIVQYPDQRLRTPCDPVESFDSELQGLCERLAEVGEESGGLAVAAPQIGVQLAVYVYRLAGCWEPVINPVVRALSDDLWSFKEGCLSIPDRFWYVSRPATVTIEYRSVSGGQGTMTESGLAGRVIQHEVDHLNGVLLVDYLSLHEWKRLTKELNVRAAGYSAADDRAIRVQRNG